MVFESFRITDRQRYIHTPRKQYHAASRVVINAAAKTRNKD